MFAFENVLLATSPINSFPVSKLNAMESNYKGGKWFSRTTKDDTTLLVRAPASFNSWLKTSNNFTGLVNYGKGPGLTVKADSKFTGLYWREDKKRLYACYDGRTIPWANWVKWCSKKQAVKASKKKN